MYRYERLLVSVGLFLIMTTLPMTTFSQDLPSSEMPSKRTLSLQEAIERVHNSPALKAAAQDIDIREGLLEQAELLPNPDISVEVDNFNGEDDLEDFDGAETTIAVSQLIELGGKRGVRRNIASHDKSLAEWDFQIQAQDLQLETMMAFYAALAAQGRLEQANKLLSLAEQGYQTVADRVDAGKVSPVEILRASVELNMTRNAFEIAQRQMIQTRHSLSSLWGDSTPGFDLVTGDFDKLLELPSREEVEAAFAENPDVKRWETALISKSANLNLEHANGMPDVTLSFGIRNFQETNDNAFVAGLEFPLPLFDRNQGGRRAAQAEVTQSVYQRDAALARLYSDLQSSYQSLLASHRQARIIKQDIMPAAEQANEAAQIGYREGKFNFLDALDAQRTLFEVKAQYIDAFSAYHEARLLVMRMTGRVAPLSTI